MINISQKRRPIRSRHSYWAVFTAQWLARCGFRPNHISLLSVVFAGLAGLCLLYSAHYWNRGMVILAAFFVLLRLLCNLFDGMIAIEGGYYSKSGEIYNDLPDRPSDVFILVGMGYATPSLFGSLELGWIAAILAILTAYVRVLGHSAGAQQYFGGPMAKQHRMAVVIIACLLSAIFNSNLIFAMALLLIAVGSFITIIRRLKFIVSDLEKRA